MQAVKSAQLGNLIPALEIIVFHAFHNLWSAFSSFVSMPYASEFDK